MGYVSKFVETSLLEEGNRLRRLPNLIHFGPLFLATCVVALQLGVKGDGELWVNDLPLIGIDGSRQIQEVSSA